MGRRRRKEEKGENKEKEEKEIRKKEENKYDVVVWLHQLDTSESKWTLAIMTRPSSIG